MDEQAVLLKIQELQRRIEFLESSQELLPLGADGWIRDYATWTYASATTFTVSGDQSARFTAGLKIKLTQTTIKYFYVVSSSFAAGSTTVTITAGTDYSLANAAITLNYYGRGLILAGFPDWFNYTPTWASSGTQPVLNNGTIIGLFKISSKSCLYRWQLIPGSTTTYGTGNYTISLPVSCSNEQIGALGLFYSRDTGTANYIRVEYISPATSVTAISFLVDPTNGNNVSNWTPTSPFTLGSGDTVRGQIEFQIP